MQRLKLALIQENLAPAGTKDDSIEEKASIQIDDTIPEVKDESSLKRTLSKASSLNNIIDPQESFMATISTIIIALNTMTSSASSNNILNNLTELVNLFTTVFIKNINIRGLFEVFEFEVEEGKKVSELLLISYINSITNLSCKPSPSTTGLLEEILRSMLVLISSNVKQDSQDGRYFLEYLGKLPIDYLKDYFDSLLNINSSCCNFASRSFNFSSNRTISEKSRLSAQLLSTFSLLQFSSEVLKSFDDLKSFSLFIKFQAQFFQFTSNFSQNDSTILVIFANFMVNFCSNYRRFLLSKLDNDELIICLGKAMYFLMRGKRKPVVSTNLYLLLEMLLSFSEDSTFIKLIYDTELNRTLIRWYEGDLGTCTSMGGFMFCLLLDLLGANLASSDGFKDQFIHEILTSILINFAQFYSITANSSLCDRFWALFNGLFRQIYNETSIDSDASRCLVDILVIFFNIIINNPQKNPLLIGQFLSDKERFIIFLRSFLDHIDSSTNSQLSAHLNESELEFTAILVGILKFIQKLSKHLNLVDVYEIPSQLATFPIPTFRRDSRGEVQRLGTRLKLSRPIDHEKWSKLVDHQIWIIIYSSISWNNYVE